MIRKKIKIYILLILPILFVSLNISANAYVSSSTNYILQNDSINIGGKDSSTSTNYSIQDTIGEIATGISTSTNYQINVGYRQTLDDDATISISGPNSISLGSLGGLVGGITNNNGTWNVETNSSAGYSLYIKATSSSAMQSSDSSISDYTASSSPNPDFNWTIGIATSTFGFSPYNSESQITKYKNDGTNCNIGTNITDGQCWQGFSTSNEAIVSKTSATDIGGEDTKINFQAEIKSNGIQESGSYVATIIITAVSN